MKTQNPQLNYSVCFNALRSASALLAAIGLLPSAPARAQGTDNSAPDVPAAIEVLAGKKVHFHAYAEGVQIYQWSGTAWVFVAPEATLFADADADGEIGTHYAGPTWENNSGSTVVGTRLAGVNVTPGAIPWLLLQAKSTTGPGCFKLTTYIQRVNTEGGVAPSAPGASVGEIARVPYTAEYFFYRAEH